MGEIFRLRSILGMRRRLTFDVAFDYAIGLLVCGRMSFAELDMRLQSIGCNDALVMDVIDALVMMDL